MNIWSPIFIPLLKISIIISWSYPVLIFCESQKWMENWKEWGGRVEAVRLYHRLALHSAWHLEGCTWSPWSSPNPWGTKYRGTALETLSASLVRKSERWMWPCLNPRPGASSGLQMPRMSYRGNKHWEGSCPHCYTHELVKTQEQICPLLSTLMQRNSLEETTK